MSTQHFWNVLIKNLKGFLLFSCCFFFFSFFGQIITDLQIKTCCTFGLCALLMLMEGWSTQIIIQIRASCPTDRRVCRLSAQCTSLHRSLLCMVMEGWLTQIMGHNAHHSTGLHCVWWWRDGALKSWDTIHITPQVSTVYGDGGWCTQIMGHNAPHSTGLYCAWWWRHSAQMMGYWLKGWVRMSLKVSDKHPTQLYRN